MTRWIWLWSSWTVRANSARRMQRNRILRSRMRLSRPALSEPVFRPALKPQNRFSLPHATRKSLQKTHRDRRWRARNANRSTALPSVRLPRFAGSCRAAHLLQLSAAACARALKCCLPSLASNAVDASRSLQPRCGDLWRPAPRRGVRRATLEATLEATTSCRAKPPRDNNNK